jgi:hypothetical protein
MGAGADPSGAAFSLLLPPAGFSLLGFFTFLPVGVGGELKTANFHSKPVFFYFLHTHSIDTPPFVLKHPLNRLSPYLAHVHFTLIFIG